MSKYTLLFIIIVIQTQNVFSREYKVPPTSTGTHAGVISDEAMLGCVKLYNEFEWLKEKIDAFNVNVHSQVSVDAYNQLIKQSENMLNNFNADCAGKQSRSAFEAAQKLNRMNR